MRKLKLDADRLALTPQNFAVTSLKRSSARRVIPVSTVTPELKNFTTQTNTEPNFALWASEANVSTVSTARSHTQKAKQQLIS